MTGGPLIRALVVLLALAVVAGCGRRGSPEAPPNATAIPRAPIYAPEPEGPTAPDRPFIGDKILQ